MSQASYISPVVTFSMQWSVDREQNIYFKQQNSDSLADRIGCLFPNLHIFFPLLFPFTNYEQFSSLWVDLHFFPLKGT